MRLGVIRNDCKGLQRIIYAQGIALGMQQEICLPAEALELSPVSSLHFENYS